MKKVLVIEDDQDIVDLLKIHLEDMHLQADHATDGLEGYQQATANHYDLIILDLMLPRMNGLDICRQLRQNRNTTPIIMLTAKSEEIDKVLGLETGADDYLAKPFSVRELIARIKAIFRRHDFNKEQQPPGKGLLRFEELELDIDKRKVVINGQRVELSPKEFELLALMASHPGKSFDRQRLLNLVWGYDFTGYEHTVNSHINRLRQKIEPDITQPKFILTTWGVGYRFTEEL